MLYLPLGNISCFRLEPVGSVGPKVTSSIELMTVGANGMVSLLCPAQSYPVPVFRYLVLSLSLSISHPTDITSTRLTFRHSIEYSINCFWNHCAIRRQNRLVALRQKWIQAISLTYPLCQEKVRSAYSVRHSLFLYRLSCSILNTNEHKNTLGKSYPRHRQTLWS